MLAFNEIYRSAAEKHGGEFVDVWDGFVDENGAFVANGPDINGQPVRLRADDGINLAKAGKRKLAFYAEKPLGKVLGDAVVTPPLAADATLAGELTPDGRRRWPGDETAEEEPEVVIGLSDLGPIDPSRPIMLRSPALDGGTEILGANPATRHECPHGRRKAGDRGIAPVAMAGSRRRFFLVR